jgi:hypothetical protein
MYFKDDNARLYVEIADSSQLKNHYLAGVNGHSQRKIRRANKSGSPLGLAVLTVRYFYVMIY